MKIKTLTYEQAKKEAKKIYSKIGRIPSPALNNECIAFTSKGFTHIIRKGRNPRPRSEQKRRFRLIPYAEKIVKKPNGTIIYRTTETKSWINRHGEKVLLTSTAHFWTFVEKINNRSVKVVVRQLNQGQRHFFSIMEAKNKKAP